MAFDSGLPGTNTLTQGRLHLTRGGPVSGKQDALFPSRLASFLTICDALFRSRFASSRKASLSFLTICLANRFTPAKSIKPLVPVSFANSCRFRSSIPARHENVKAALCSSSTWLSCEEADSLASASWSGLSLAFLLHLDLCFM